MKVHGHRASRRRLLAGLAVLACLVPCFLLYAKYVNLGPYRTDGGVVQVIESHAVSRTELREAAPETKSPAPPARPVLPVLPVVPVAPLLPIDPLRRGGASQQFAPVAERPDVHCDGLRDDGASPADVWACRKAVAQQLALDACGELLAHPPTPPFLATRLQLGFLHGTPERHPENLTIPIYVEQYGDFVSASVQSSGAWEPTEVNSVLYGLRDAESSGVANPVLLDVGSNIGVFAFSAAVFGYDVVAFEAMERNQQAIYSTLCVNPALRERVTLLPYALGAANAACTMFSDSQNVADGHVACTAQAREDLLGQGYTERSSMHVVTLGDYMRDVPVHVMKMDVEGHESKILQARGDFLDGPLQHVVAELGWSGLLRQDNRTREEVAAVHPGAFLDAGFHFRRGSLWGPTLHGEQADALRHSFMQMQAGETNLYMSRPLHGTEEAQTAAAPLATDSEAQ